MARAHIFRIRHGSFVKSVMEKRYVLFDLDGTLTNSYRGIINALKYSLSKFTVEPKEETFNKIIGPPVVW